ncbi:MAG: hypothetical protein JOZ62_23815 [Acidobacteriaceae bacterium]|nr:hypothetical protein [Acidobacteriaceae bacterium]
MFRPWAAIAFSTLIFAGCGNNMRSKQKVQDAILSRLQTHSGLDLSALDVMTTSVAFEKNMAYATVAFHPKGDPAVNSGMVMKYTLANRGGKWVVVNVGDSRERTPSGHAATGMEGLPPGHPPIDGRVQ